MQTDKFKSFWKVEGAYTSKSFNLSTKLRGNIILFYTTLIKSLCKHKIKIQNLLSDFQKVRHLDWYNRPIYRQTNTHTNRQMTIKTDIKVLYEAHNI
jgi:hypothetical protein